MLRDPAARRMAAEPFGGYCSLLIEMWLDPSKSLPADDEELALLSRLGKRWPRFAAQILALFTVRDGRYCSPIIDAAHANCEKKSSAAKTAVNARETRKVQMYPYLEPETGSTDDRPMIDRLTTDDQTMIDRSSNVKVKVKVEPPPYNPPPSRLPKALRKGNPANDDTFRLFDAAYPRPSNGRSLRRAEARLTWDVLIAAGEPVAAILEGVTRYAANIAAVGKYEYVAMMTTWLNQRRWEETHVYDPGCTEAQAVAARRDAELRERRSAHRGRYEPAYHAWCLELARAAVADPAYVRHWRIELEETIKRRAASGMAKSAEKLKGLLAGDPAAQLEDQVRRWLTQNPPPDFWTWDTVHNPEAMQ